jgi:hypothetical protein
MICRGSSGGSLFLSKYHNKMTSITYNCDGITFRIIVTYGDDHTSELVLNKTSCPTIDNGTIAKLENGTLRGISYDPESKIMYGVYPICTTKGGMTPEWIANDYKTFTIRVGHVDLNFRRKYYIDDIVKCLRAYYEWNKPSWYSITRQYIDVDTALVSYILATIAGIVTTFYWR